MNFQNWNLDRNSTTVESAIGYREFIKNESNIAYVGEHALAEKYCHVSVDSEPVEGVTICSFDGYNGVQLGDCDGNMAFWVPWFYGLSPDTPIPELK